MNQERSCCPAPLCLVAFRAWEEAEIEVRRNVLLFVGEPRADDLADASPIPSARTADGQWNHTGNGG